MFLVVPEHKRCDLLCAGKKLVRDVSRTMDYYQVFSRMVRYFLLLGLWGMDIGDASTAALRDGRAQQSGSQVLALQGTCASRLEEAQAQRAGSSGSSNRFSREIR